MANNTQANWNIVKIIYGSGHPYVRMIDKECTCLFHWIQSFNKHTKQLKKLEFQDQHISLCHQYKGAKSLGEVESLYVLIFCWWFLFEVAFEVGVHELNNWLNFWHFFVKQWGGFMVHVSILSFSFL